MVAKSLHRSVDLVNSIRKSLVTNQLIKGTDKVLLSISGGQDSICLLVVFNQLHAQMELSLGLLWCHHLWQIDSFSLMRQMAKISYLFQLNSCFAITPKPVLSELLARNWRHNCSYRICFFYNYYKITLAHSANDKAETILLNLMRGTGVTGLSPLRWEKRISEHFVKKEEHVSQLSTFPNSLFFWSPFFVFQRNTEKNDEIFLNKQRVKNEIERKTAVHITPLGYEIKDFKKLIKIFDPLGTFKSKQKLYVKKVKIQKCSSLFYMVEQLDDNCLTLPTIIIKKKFPWIIEKVKLKKKKKRFCTTCPPSLFTPCIIPRSPTTFHDSLVTSFNPNIVVHEPPRGVKIFGGSESSWEFGVERSYMEKKVLLRLPYPPLGGSGFEKPYRFFKPPLLSPPKGGVGYIEDFKPKGEGSSIGGVHRMGRQQKFLRKIKSNNKKRFHFVSYTFFKICSTSLEQIQNNSNFNLFYTSGCLLESKRCANRFLTNFLQVKSTIKSRHFFICKIRNSWYVWLNFPQLRKPLSMRSKDSQITRSPDPQIPRSPTTFHAKQNYFPCEAKLRLGSGNYEKQLVIRGLKLEESKKEKVHVHSNHFSYPRGVKNLADDFYTLSNLIPDFWLGSSPLTGELNFVRLKKNYSTIRPLLSLSRFEISKLCIFWHLPIYPDKSNQKVNFLRNRVRKQLLPTIKLFFNSRIENVLLQFAEIFFAEDNYINQITKELFQKFLMAKVAPQFYPLITNVVEEKGMKGGFIKGDEAFFYSRGSRLTFQPLTLANIWKFETGVNSAIHRSTDSLVYQQNWGSIYFFPMSHWKGGIKSDAMNLVNRIGLLLSPCPYPLDPQRSFGSHGEGVQVFVDHSKEITKSCLTKKLAKQANENIEYDFFTLSLCFLQSDFLKSPVKSKHFSYPQRGLLIKTFDPKGGLLITPLWGGQFPPTGFSNPFIKSSIEKSLGSPLGAKPLTPKGGLRVKKLVQTEDLKSKQGTFKSMQNLSTSFHKAEGIIGGRPLAFKTTTLSPCFSKSPAPPKGEMGRRFESRAGSHATKKSFCSLTLNPPPLGGGKGGVQEKKYNISFSNALMGRKNLVNELSRLMQEDKNIQSQGFKDFPPLHEIRSPVLINYVDHRLGKIVGLKGVTMINGGVALHTRKVAKNKKVEKILKSKTFKNSFISHLHINSFFIGYVDHNKLTSILSWTNLKLVRSLPFSATLKCQTVYKNVSVLQSMKIVPRFSVPMEATFSMWNRKLCVVKKFNRSSKGKKRGALLCTFNKTLNCNTNPLSTIPLTINPLLSFIPKGVITSFLRLDRTPLKGGTIKAKNMVTGFYSKRGKDKKTSITFDPKVLNNTEKILHNKKMGNIFSCASPKFILKFDKFDMEKKDIYWPLIISFLPIALQRRFVKLFLVNENGKQVRYSQIEHFIAIIKKFFL